MIDITLWSKDRACQLDLTLSSYKYYFSEWKSMPLDIIYTFSNSDYEAGYEKVKLYHPEFNWIKESNFRIDTLNSIFLRKNDYQAFMVDDDVFIDNFSIKDAEFDRFFKDQRVSCISPRLAPYIDYCYPASRNSPQPLFLNNDLIIWDWRGGYFDWGYPWSVASFHVFRKKDLINLSLVYFKGPNTFEDSIIRSVNFTNRDLMICYKNAKCICSTNNKVQTENNNICSNINSIKSLNEDFLKNKRLDYNINNKTIINMCHGPLKYEWRAI